MRTILAATLMLLATGQARARDIVIGAGFRLSGRFATYGEDAKAGADLAVAELNAKGETTGLQGVDGAFTHKGSGDNTDQRPFVFELVGGQFHRVR